MKLAIFTFVAALSAGAASAQSISAADLKAQIDARVGGLNEYQELLNDPDPARSMAAMEIMLASGDAALVSMAKEYGIFSPNADVRKAALDGYFASGPILEFQVDASNVNKLRSFSSDLDWYVGSVSAQNMGYMQVKLGDWNEEQRCFAVTGWDEGLYDGCFLRNSENGVSVYLWKSWWQLALNDKGALVGNGETKYNKGIPISIQVAQ